MDSIISVGIDIGTTTTSMIISKLSFKNTAVSYMVPKVDITNKKIIYRSNIYETPVIDSKHLDGKGIRAIVAYEYENAGITPDQVDSGAVIITGESLLKDNADMIISELSDYAGEFVVAPAGPNYESIIAGKGSGVQEFSKDNNCIAANIDIGGGTSNIAIFAYGELVGCTSLDIGGRLLKYNDDGIITYVSSRLNDLVREYGFQLVPGEMRVTTERLRYLTDIMTEILFQTFIAGEHKLMRIALTKNCEPFKNLPLVRYFSFSGGVAECIYNQDSDIYKYNDLGVSLAHSIIESSYIKNKTLLRPKETISATVVGAGIYTTSVSGSTITYDNEIFPLKNIPTYFVTEKTEKSAINGNAEDLINVFSMAIKQFGTDCFVLCLKGSPKATYNEICRLAKTLAYCSDEVMENDTPLIISVRNDMAKALGELISNYMNKRRAIICMDGLEISDGDYIDIGKPIMNGLTLPVVIKTLIFK